MTLFLDFRTDGKAGDLLREPRLYEAGVRDGAVTFGPKLEAFPEARVVGRQIVFATHGFNVDRAGGVVALEALETQLALPAGYTMIGVLWPGSWYVPAINYPFEGKDASLCGERLADWAADGLPGAAGVSFLSHSLGGRLILRAVTRLQGRAQQVCVTAGAVDSRCLGPGGAFDAVRGKSDRVTVLASESDLVLATAYPAGTLFSRILRQDRHPFGTALGLRGSDPRALAGVANQLIPKAQDHGHGDYLPPSKPGNRNRRAARSIGAMAAAVTGAAPSWPWANRIPR